NGVGLNTDGTNLSVEGTATDVAGNERRATVGGTNGINIDSVKPTLTISVNGSTPSASLEHGNTYFAGQFSLGAVPTLSCTAADALSGPDGCAITSTGGGTANANGTGTFTFTATATDKAGNTATVTGSYRVIYAWAGFLQPINDTAHQVGTSTSIFKAGSSVPAKFQLKRADGTVVQANTAPEWLTPAKGSATSSPVDENLYIDPATSGNLYRWDSTAQQYIYNWGTAKNQAGNYWRIGVKLDDGQIYFVNIGLR
ncbi:MAG TPA: PxKF domain-containing protein, partial [Chloroflexota bacterium]|nr:PxKF domain-containing protein [Chloroflexota bacterium]